MNKLLKVLEVLSASNLLRKNLQPGEPSDYAIHAYHATPKENLKSILKSGLVPGKQAPAGQEWSGKWSGKGIYYHQTFPYHELDNAFDREDGELINVVIEVKFNTYSKYVVPDEEFGDPEDTPDIMASKGPIAVGINPSPKAIIAVHLPDTEKAREWAAEVKITKPVKFHEVSNA